MGYKCIVCNYDGLYEPPYDERGIASDEICPCCGFHYGYDDDNKDDTIYKIWREKWVKEGHVWFSKGRPQPKNWDYNIQMKE